MIKSLDPLRARKKVGHTAVSAIKPITQKKNQMFLCKNKDRSCQIAAFFCQTSPAENHFDLELRSKVFYATNFEKVGSILVSACPCVCASVRPFKKNQARVLKLYICIPRQN